MKSNTKSTSSSLIGFNCRTELTEWLVTFGTRWVQIHEIGDMVRLGYPEKEGYIERKYGGSIVDYLRFRLTDKGLEFINETG